MSCKVSTFSKKSHGNRTFSQDGRLGPHVSQENRELSHEGQLGPNVSH